MTRDLILVKREFNGKKCGGDCTLNGLASDEDDLCYLDGMPLNHDECGHCLRTAACLATPPRAC